MLVIFCRLQIVSEGGVIRVTFRSFRRLKTRIQIKLIEPLTISESSMNSALTVGPSIC